MVVGWCWFSSMGSQCKKKSLKSKSSFPKLSYHSPGPTSPPCLWGPLYRPNSHRYSQRLVQWRSPRWRQREASSQRLPDNFQQNGMSQHVQSCRFESKIGSPPTLGVFLGLGRAKSAKWYRLHRNLRCFIVRSFQPICESAAKVGDVWHIIRFILLHSCSCLKIFTDDVHLHQWYGSFWDYKILPLQNYSRNEMFNRVLPS